MKQALDYINAMKAAQDQGVPIDWSAVVRTVAGILAQELQNEQPVIMD